jgi:uncharacterized membrane protein YdbT with pleckstrin-like domain
MRREDLLPGEHLVLVARQHWVVVFRPFVLTILGAVILMIVALQVPSQAELRLFVLLGLVILAVVVLNLYYWRWRAHEYVLTDQRVILNEGIVGRFSRSIAVDRIQDLTTRQGLWGRTWGFGDIELESAGRDSGEVLQKIPHPQQFRNEIFAQIEARRRPSGA